MPWKDDIWNSLSFFLVLTWVCTGYNMSSMVIHVALKMHSNFTAICSSPSSTVKWWEYHLWFLSQAFGWNKKEAIDNTWTNEHGHVSVTLYLWTLKFEFHLIVTYHKIIILIVFFSHLKMLKTMLISKAIQKEAIQKEAIVQIWPMDHRLAYGP